MHIAQEMLNFARRYQTIYCYGAGIYAAAILRFLEAQGVEAVGCIVTDGTSEQKEYMGYPVNSLSDAVFEKDSGIILALAESWHEMVAAGLEQHDIDEARIYRVTAEEITTIRLWEGVALNPHDDCQREDGLQYEERYQALRSRFSKIEVRMLGIGAVGTALHELFYHKRYGLPREDTYYLFVFFGGKVNPWDNTFERPNSFLYEVFHGEQFSAVCHENIAFWKYVFAHHLEELTFNVLWSFVPIIHDSIHKMHTGAFVGCGNARLDLSPVERAGKKRLAKMGGKEEFVLFFARDAVYYKKNWIGVIDEPLRIMDIYRNSDIAPMRKAAKYLSERGISSVRIGATPLPDTDMGCIIDYAGKFHEDFMDFYLAKHCKFYVGDHSGAMFFTVYWERPMVMVNLPNFTGFYDGTFPFDPKRDLGIYHKFYSKRKKRLLNLSEILRIEDCSHEKPIYSGNVNVMMKYYENDIVPIANTEDEILAVTQEMEDRLQGNVTYTEEDEHLQEAFWSILRPYVDARPEVLFYDVRVGRDFLRQNLWMTK